MSGTKTGGAKAAKTNTERHGEDFYKIIGSKGGKNFNPKKPKGFAFAKLNLTEDHPAHPRNAGYKGGQISSRQGTKNGTRNHNTGDIRQFAGVAGEN
jgi:hypothetical protein